MLFFTYYHKAENVMFVNENHSKIKIIDLGKCKIMQSKDDLFEDFYVGTRYYQGVWRRGFERRI